MLTGAGDPADAGQALEFIEDDELVEITPSAIRLRKKFLGSMSANVPRGLMPGRDRSA